MNRDSRWLWLIMGSAILTNVSSRMDILDRLLPAVHKDTVHAAIELLMLIVTAVSGVLIASPLKNLSARGRRHYMRDRVKVDTKLAAQMVSHER